MVRWVVGSILHGGSIELFSFQPVLHDWYNKGRGMCYPVCGMVHIKEPLLLIGKSSPCGGSGFPHLAYLNGPLPYVRRHITVTKCVECVVKQNTSFNSQPISSLANANVVL